MLSIMEQKRNKQLEGYRCLNISMHSMIQQVRLPPGKSLPEWVATNILDFYNDVSTIWAAVQDNPSLPAFGPGEGFPPNVQYRWMEGSGENVKYISVSASVYIETACYNMMNVLDVTSGLDVSGLSKWAM
jgi:hypothetical protein